jgi:hypothetical protein
MNMELIIYVLLPIFDVYEMEKDVMHKPLTQYWQDEKYIQSSSRKV